MYQPKPPPFNPDVATLAQYTGDELQNIAQAQADKVDAVQFNVLHAEPSKPREGMTVNADGTDWNPGSGAGLYQYVGGSWTALSGGGGGGATNLAYTASPTNGIVTSNTGTDATLPLADGTNAGLLKPADFTKLSNTSGTNTGDQDLSSYATTAAVAAGYQPLDAQLTSVAGLSYSGNTLKVVRVNATETGFELAAASAGSGDVVGPASAVNNNVAFFDGVTGKLIKDSGLSLSGSNTGDQDLSTYAPLASPALTGTPTAPTAVPGTNSTQIATTAYVDAAVTAGGGGGGADILEFQAFT